MSPVSFSPEVMDQITNPATTFENALRLVLDDPGASFLRLLHPGGRSPDEDAFAYLMHSKSRWAVGCYGREALLRLHWDAYTGSSGTETRRAILSVFLSDAQWETTVLGSASALMRLTNDAAPAPNTTGNRAQKLVADREHQDLRQRRYALVVRMVAYWILNEVLGGASPEAIRLMLALGLPDLTPVEMAPFHAMAAASVAL